MSWPWNRVRGHSRSFESGTIRYIVYCLQLVFFSNFVPKMHRFWDIRLQKCCDLENRVRCPSRSLEMSPCYRAHTTSYWRSIVSVALSRVVSEIFNVEFVYGFLLVFFSNFVPQNAPFLRYLICKYTVTLKPGLVVTQGHRKWYHSIRHPWFPNVP